MLRAILKLVAVGGVVTLCGMASSDELYAASGGALLALPFAVVLIDRKKAVRAASEPVDLARAHTTLDVMPLPAPESPEDIEGLTVRAPMSNQEAYEMHARYAPNFDQQAAIARYEAQRDEVLSQEAASDPASFDQGRYAAALQYAEAFDAQLRNRRTAAYEVAPPRRMARGSVTPQRYRVIDKTFATSPDWEGEEKTIVGVPPAKRAT